MPLDKQSLSIVHMVFGYYPSQIWGGVTPIVQTLSKGLTERGHKVTILGSNILDYGRRIKPYSFTEIQDGIEIVYIHAHWTNRRPDSFGFIWMPDIWRFRHLLQEADVVHIHGYRSFPFLAGTVLSQRARTPYIIQPHGTLPSELGRARMKRLFDSTVGPYLLSRAAFCIAQSTNEINDLIRFGMDVTKIAHIKNPFTPPSELPDGSDFRIRYAIPEEIPIILFLSRLHLKKGLDILIEAFYLVRQRMPSILCIVGPDDGYESRARELVAKFNLEEATVFTGPLYNEDKLAAYRAANVYVLPSRGVEGLPQTIVEALFCSVPLIVSNLVDVANLIHLRAGLSVALNPEAFAAAIIEILTSPTQYSSRAREIFSENFQLSSILDQYEDVYLRSAQSLTHNCDNA